MDDIRYTTITSEPDTSFWKTLASLKLEQWKLNDEPKPIVGYLGPRNSASNQHILRLTHQSLLPSSIIPVPPPLLPIHPEKFASTTPSPSSPSIVSVASGSTGTVSSSTASSSPSLSSIPSSVPLSSFPSYNLQDSLYFYGTLYVFNTIEQLKTMDKESLLYTHAYQRYQYYYRTNQGSNHKPDSSNSSFPSSSSSLSSSSISSSTRTPILPSYSDFILLVYVNHKDYTFIYWFGYPCLVRRLSNPSPSLDSQPSLSLSSTVSTVTTKVTDFFTVTVDKPSISLSTATVAALPNDENDPTDTLWALATHYVLKCYAYYHQCYEYSSSLSSLSSSSSSSSVVRNIYQLPLLVGLSVNEIAAIVTEIPSLSSVLSPFLSILPVIDLSTVPTLSSSSPFYLLSMNEYRSVLTILYHHRPDWSNTLPSLPVNGCLHPFYIFFDLSVSSPSVSSSPSSPPLIFSWYHRTLLNDLYLLHSIYSSSVLASTAIPLLHYCPSTSHFYYINDKLQAYLQQHKHNSLLSSTLSSTSSSLFMTTDDKLQYPQYVKDDSSRLFVVSFTDLFPLDLSLLPSSSSPSSSYTTVGWEPNTKQQYLPRKISLQSSFNAATIATTAVNLNLSLMKWRMLPELNIPLVAHQRILILGCGTLGCYLSRILLGWGFTNFTFVDNGTVSYSNPVRQPLYEFNDAIHPSDASSSAASSQSHNYKAHLAATALQRILPSVRTAAYVLEIPMPGHKVSENYYVSKTRNDLETLHTLIQSHDVIFLLTDTRESRWLPTLWGSYYQKLVFTIGLGFEHFLVMRHGMYTDNDMDTLRKSTENIHHSSVSASSSDRLGCYFCTDTTVSAPTDSTRHRSMDQQCTITRPGNAPMACSLATELLVSLLHHPEQGYAPAYDTHGTPGNSTASLASSSSSSRLLDAASDKSSSSSSPLGILPHQIRFFMNTYSLLLAHTKAFQHCPSCSPSLMKLWYTYCQSSDNHDTENNDTINGSITEQPMDRSEKNSKHTEQNHPTKPYRSITTAQYDWLYTVFNGSTDIIENITGFTQQQQSYDKLESLIETLD